MLFTSNINRYNTSFYVNKLSTSTYKYSIYKYKNKSIYKYVLNLRSLGLFGKRIITTYVITH